MITITIAVAAAQFGCTSEEFRSSVRPNVITQGETININTASQAELTRIPFIGEKLAEEIVRYRETNGRFQRAESMLLLDGVSDRRFREIRHLIRVD